MSMKRDDLKCRSADLVFFFSFFFFSFFFFLLLDRTSMLKLQARITIDEEVLKEEGQKPAGKIYVNCNL